MRPGRTASPFLGACRVLTPSSVCISVQLDLSGVLGTSSVSIALEPECRFLGPAPELSSIRSPGGRSVC